MLRGLLAFLALGLALAGAARGEVPVPPLQSRVTDLTHTLSAEQRQALESRLAAFEMENGSQLAVLLVPTTQPETIEQYGIRVAEAWKLGRKGMDDGALLLVAKEDRALRIEVGYGLEGAIPDAVAKRIIEEIIVPRFREGDFAGGVNAGMNALMGLVKGEALPAPPSRDTRQTGVALLEDALPLALLFVFVVGGVLRALLGRLLGAGVASGLAFAVGWWVLGGFLVSAVLAAIVFFITLAGGNGGGRYWGGGGFSGGGFGGGGGFSGGGGGFGGGGASGRW